MARGNKEVKNLGANGWEGDLEVSTASLVKDNEQIELTGYCVVETR